MSHAVWLYPFVCLGFREVEERLAKRGITVTYLYFGHPRRLEAGIHLKRKSKDRCPITNVGHDGGRIDSRLTMSGMTEGDGAGMTERDGFSFDHIGKDEDNRSLLTRKGWKGTFIFTTQHVHPSSDSV